MWIEKSNNVKSLVKNWLKLNFFRISTRILGGGGQINSPNEKNEVYRIPCPVIAVVTAKKTLLWFAA